MSGVTFWGKRGYKKSEFIWKGLEDVTRGRGKLLINVGEGHTTLRKIYSTTLRRVKVTVDYGHKRDGFIADRN